MNIEIINAKKQTKQLRSFWFQEFFNKSSNVTLLLLNKLVEEKRFDDVLKVAEKHIQEVATSNSKSSGGGTEQQRFVSLDSLKLVSEAMLLKNDAGALEQGIKFFKKVEELKLATPDRCIHQMVHLALDQVFFSLLNLFFKSLKFKSYRNNLN